MSRTSKVAFQTAAKVCVDCLDEGTRLYVAAALRRAGLKVVETRDAPLLVALTGAAVAEELETIRCHLQRGEAVLCWGVHDESRAGDLSSARALAEQWTVERLAEQLGALVSASLESLVEVLRLRSLGIDVQAPVAPLDPAATVLVQRLASRLYALPRAPSLDHPTPLRVEIADDSEPALCCGKVRIPLPSVEVTAQALALARRQVLSEAPPLPPMAPDAAELARILKPPPRLLSEPTSKRLLRCFGLDIPNEILCRSPSEASRAAEQLGGDVVLKLARPELDTKLAQGLVVTDALGPTAVRKATADLLARGDELGPPASLGVLVCQRVAGGTSLWLQLDHHPLLGSVLLGGLGDIPTPAPQLALRLPFDSAAAWRALHLARVPGTIAVLTALTLALARLSSAIESLGSGISRLEIHPLTARDDLPAALVLDALVRLEVVARRDRPPRR